MARRKDGIPELKLLITEDPEGMAYVQLNSRDVTMQISARDLVVIDMRRPRGGATTQVPAATPKLSGLGEARAQ